MNKLLRLPGLIDIHVHLRDPVTTHKEDFYTGTAAALAGGVTTVFDMPTKSYHMLTIEELNKKITIVKQKALCDWGLYFGSTGENTAIFKMIVDKVIGLKIYLEATTGHALIDEDRLERVFNNWPKTKIIVVHTEENKAELALGLSAKLGNKIHITHVNTRSLLEKIMKAKKDGVNITCDTTPNYLFLDADKGKKLNSFGGIKPPLATKDDIKFLWNNLDKIDCIATDHAPHTIEEKKSDNPPTGFPGLETTLPLLLTAVSEGRIPLDEVIRLTNTNPQSIFNFRQDKDTYVEVDQEEEYIIRNEDLKTKCVWSPYNGWKMKGRVKKVFLRGTKVYENGEILAKPGFGRNISL